MSSLDRLIREELAEIADSMPVPHDLADRVIRRHLQRRWWRRLGAGFCALAVAAAAGAAVTLQVGSSDPQPAPPGNVVYAIRETGGLKVPPYEPWRVLDPKTGLYRTVDVGSVSAPTADLRYAAVTPPRVGGIQPPPKIGRYASTTGEIRWYDIPNTPHGDPIISPDGRYAAVAGSDGVMVVDLATGKMVRTLVAMPYVLTGPETVGQPGTFSVAEPKRLITGELQVHGNAAMWLPDSRRILIGEYVLGLDNGGRVLSRPQGWAVLSGRPDGSGLLVFRPDASVFRADGRRKALDTKDDPPTGWTYGVTDGKGKIVRQVTVKPDCLPPGTTPFCWDSAAIGWRGPDQLLLGAVNDKNQWSIRAVDLNDGSSRVVKRIESSVDRLVIAPATDGSDVHPSAIF